jgi:hypothetical protein
MEEVKASTEPAVALAKRPPHSLFDLFPFAPFKLSPAELNSSPRSDS